LHKTASGYQVLFFIGRDNMLSLEKINEFLSVGLKSAQIELFEEISSTNTYLKEKGAEREEMSVAVASRQTAGKGRLGRSFYSPQESGVYFSVLLKPTLAIDKAILITTAAAVAVTRALELLGQKNAKIKWVNDIYVNNKKVCGI
jgi:BirA family biotin operon repressor/biotin-[acetyl-CoA-carboxylase] ligase